MSSFLSGLFKGFGNQLESQRKHNRQQLGLSDIHHFHFLDLIAQSQMNALNGLSSKQFVKYCAYCKTSYTMDYKAESCKNCGANEYV